ncbi:Tyrosine kinase catalytic domain protein [Ceratobasidium sp. AG-Ba]|nr:Tyrosine kinase catalytic domain protein [Ceratobasidium sp. AG-Ba]
MENGTLRQYISKNPETDRYRLCTQIADGLSYLHTAGITHGDLKGGNVLVSDDGTVKLADFGNAALKEWATLEFTNSGDGTGCSMRWTAPEILAGTSEKHTTESDVYALGMTLYEAVTGESPFTGKQDRAIPYIVTVMKETPARPTRLDLIELSQATALWEVMSTCWAYKPAHRPSAHDVYTILKQAEISSKLGILNTTPQFPHDVLLMIIRIRIRTLVHSFSTLRRRETGDEASDHWQDLVDLMLLSALFADMVCEEWNRHWPATVPRKRLLAE